MAAEEKDKYRCQASLEQDLRDRLLEEPLPAAGGKYTSQLNDEALADKRLRRFLTKCKASRIQFNQQAFASSSKWQCESLGLGDSHGALRAEFLDVAAGKNYARDKLHETIHGPLKRHISSSANRVSDVCCSITGCCVSKSQGPSLKMARNIVKKFQAEVLKQQIPAGTLLIFTLKSNLGHTNEAPPVFLGTAITKPAAQVFIHAWRRDDSAQAAGLVDLVGPHSLPTQVLAEVFFYKLVEELAEIPGELLVASRKLFVCNLAVITSYGTSH